MSYIRYSIDRSKMVPDGHVSVKGKLVQVVQRFPEGRHAKGKEAFRILVVPTQQPQRVGLQVFVTQHVEDGQTLL